MSLQLQGVIVGGLVSLVVTVVGLFVARWLRSFGGVDCDIVWQNTMGAGSVDSPGGVQVLERQLRVTFLNRKDIPITVRQMDVKFYKEGKPLDERERPVVEFADVGRMPLDLVTLPSRIPVTRTISVAPGHNQYDRQRAVEEADRVVFEANIEEAPEITMELALWNNLKPQTACYRQPGWHKVFRG